MRASSIQRALRSAITDSANLLSGPRALEAEAVHNARKALKRARAGLRLLRDAEDRSFYIHDNARLRDIAKPLSMLRDEAILLEKVAGIRSKANSGQISKLLEALQHQLEVDCRRLHSQARNSGLAQAKAREIIKVADDVARRPLDDAKAGVILAGLKRIYRKGRAATKLVAREPTDANWHEARKQSKYLFNGLEFVARNKGHSKKLLKRSKSVGDKLGDDHDLVLLEARLAAMPSTRSAARSEFALELKKWRRKLQKKALKKSESLYAMKPKAFAVMLGPKLR